LIPTYFCIGGSIIIFAVAVAEPALIDDGMDAAAGPSSSVSPQQVTPVGKFKIYLGTQYLCFLYVIINSNLLNTYVYNDTYSYCNFSFLIISHSEKKRLYSERDGVQQR
jgi:hypothetical protein